MKLNNNKMYIGCIPVDAQPTHPTDQSPCDIWDCECCNKPMWVSEKKRAYLENRPNVEIYCMRCLVHASIDAGIEPEFQDITRMN